MSGRSAGHGERELTEVEDSSDDSEEGDLFLGREPNGFESALIHEVDNRSAPDFG